MLDQSWNKIDTVSMLKKLANELKKTLSQLDKKINFIKKGPSWDFTKKQSNTKKMIAFEEKTRLKFTTELSNLSMKQKDLQAQLDLWSKLPRPSSKQSQSPASKNQGHRSRRYQANYRHF